MGALSVRLSVLALVAGFGGLGPVAAQTSSAEVEQGETASAQVRLEGFRSARFGMDEAAVRDAIQADFSLSDDAIEDSENVAERTRILSARVADVLTDGGTADVSYVFGYASRMLSQVSIVWSAQSDPDMTADQLIANANALQTFFLQAGYEPQSVVANVQVPEGLLVFRGRDVQGRMIVLLLRGVTSGDTAAGAQTATGESAAGPVLNPTSLLLAYLADPENPDVFAVQPGQF
jgi:hypothetical protein